MLLPPLLAGLCSGLLPAQDPAPLVCESPEPAECPESTELTGCGEQTGRGGVDWFEGTWPEALAEARRTGQLLFVHVSRDACPYCRKLESTTLRDATVGKELRDLVCFELNSSRPEHAPIARSFAPTLYPTMLFLESDGRVRDRVLGYLDAEGLLREARRIRRDENTLTGLARAIAARPGDVEARYALALKLRQFGDEEGYREQVAAIAEHDPEGRTLPSRRIRMERTVQRAQGTLDPTELYGLLASEGEPDLLFEGWYAVWQLESYLERVADKAAARRAHRGRKFAAARNLWPNVGDDSPHLVSLGSSIARSYFEGRNYLELTELEWALGVARRVAELAPKDVSAQDAFACSLYAVGRVQDAIVQIQVCIDREPRNPTWRERLRTFRGQR